MRQTLFAIVATVVVSSLATSAHADVILSTDFTGRTVSGDTASNITWTTNGVSDPGDMTAVETDGDATDELAGLFDTANAQGHFAPNLNVDNEGGWSTSSSVSLTLTVPLISLEDVVIDWQHFNNSGVFQGVSRTAGYTVTVTGSTSGLLDSESFVATGTSGIETLTFAAPLLLSSSETWEVAILADNGGSGPGNNTGLDGLTLNGTIVPVVPEPSTIVLAGLGLVSLTFTGRRRKRA